MHFTARRYASVAYAMAMRPCPSVSVTGLSSIETAERIKLVFGTGASTARRYARAVYVVVVCPSVCLSVRPPQAGIISKRLDESSWFLARMLFFHLYPTLHYKEIWVSPKIRTFL